MPSTNHRLVSQPIVAQKKGQQQHCRHHHHHRTMEDTVAGCCKSSILLGNDQFERSFILWSEGAYSCGVCNWYLFHRSPTIDDDPTLTILFVLLCKHRPFPYISMPRVIVVVVIVTTPNRHKSENDDSCFHTGHFLVYVPLDMSVVTMARAMTAKMANSPIR